LRLFYGTRCIFAHGNADKTVSDKYGVLYNPPKSIELIAIKDITKTQTNSGTFNAKLLSPSEAERVAKDCGEYLVKIWKKAIDERDELSVDYYQYCTVNSFYTYAACIIGSSIACYIWP